MSLESIAAALRERGLRPVIDAQLELVVCDCICGAQDSDPLHLWRPVRVARRGGGRLAVLCTSCGREEVADV
jgi:hypothetical protein